ncbi:hypothetical protein HDU97_004304 [Phlyctochytrium planicorne]|nr:hypothetical protein HDU97_004304 [Phlyctochytrium planicorne]
MGYGKIRDEKNDNGDRNRNPLTDPRVLAPLALHLVLHKLTSWILFPGSKSLTKKQHLFVEKIPSTANALIVSIPVIKLLLWDRPWRKGQWLKPYPDTLDRVFAAHFAYTLYDLGIMAYVEGEHPSVWLHHVVGECRPLFPPFDIASSEGVLGTGFMRRYRIASFFPAAFCPTEITVVPTNILYLLQNAEKVGLAPIVSSALQTPLLIARCVLFTIFRLFTGPAAIYYAIQGEEGKTVEDKILSFWKKYRKLPLLVSSLTLFNILALSGLNTWWTVLVYKALFRHMRALSVTAGSTGIHHI